MSRLIDLILRQNLTTPIRDALKDVVVISADNVADYLEREQNWFISTVNDLYAMVPPFKDCFIEYRLKKPVGSIGWMLHRTDLRDEGSFSRAHYDSKDVPEARWMIHGYMYMEAHPAQPQMWVELFLRENGSLVPIQGDLPYMIRPTVDSIFTQAHKNDEFGKWLEAVLAFLVGVLWTCVFMNCKNIQTEDVQPNPKLNRVHVKKYHQPMRVFKILKIYAMGGGRADQEGKGGAHSDPSQHIRRGHFKHFSEAAPLFGKLSGAYWWNDTTVGKAEHGEIRKEYEVSP